MQPAIGVDALRNSRHPRGRGEGKEWLHMSEDYEFDPFEYAQELAAGESLGRSDLEERGPRGTAA